MFNHNRIDDVLNLMLIVAALALPVGNAVRHAFAPAPGTEAGMARAPVVAPAVRADGARPSATRG